MSLGIQCRQSHLIFFKTLSQDGDDPSIQDGRFGVTFSPSGELEVSVVPKGFDVHQSGFNLELLISGVRHIDDVFLVFQEFAVDDVLEIELLLFFLFVSEGLAGDFNDSLPMSGLDGRLLQIDDQREHFLEVIHFFLQFQISRPGLKILRQFEALSSELFHVFQDFIQLLGG